MKQSNKLIVKKVTNLLHALSVQILISACGSRILNYRTGLCPKCGQVPEASDRLDDHGNTDDYHRCSYRRERIYEDQHAETDRRDAHDKRDPPKASDVSDDKDRLKQVVQTDYEDNDSEDDIKEIEHCIRLDQQINAQSDEQNTRYDRRNINDSLVFSDKEQDHLEYADTDDRDSSRARQHPRCLVRPYNKRHSDKKEQDTCDYHVVTY